MPKKKKTNKTIKKKSSKTPQEVTVVPSDDFPDEVASDIDDLVAAPSPSVLEHPVKRNKSGLEKIRTREREIRALNDDPVPVFTPSGVATHPNTKGNKAVLPSIDGHKKVDAEARRKHAVAQEGGTENTPGPSGAPRPSKGGKNEATLPSSDGSKKVTDEFATKKAKAQDGGIDEVATPFGMHKPVVRHGGVSLPKMKPGN